MSSEADGERRTETPHPREAPPDRRIVERVRGTRPGDVSVKVYRPEFEGFERVGRGRLEARLELERPKGAFGALRRFLVGSPIHSALEHEERLSKKKALAVFSSDALSSVAYTPQETLIILLAAGTAAIAWSLPISVAVVALLAIVVTSYRQTIYAYPSGGGSYIVARANLGELPGLIAAGALVVGYVLTVSVSVASAVDQLVSAVPTLLPWRVWLGVGAVGVVSLANLRGIRESGNIFAAPTYVFLAAMYAMVGLGMVKLLTGTLEVPQPAALPSPIEPLSIFLILRAFAVGSAVMTGTEAISNGIPAFRPPEPRNAARTLVAMAAILAVMFLGLSVLIVGGQVIPTEQETVISILARSVFGQGPLYYVVQASAVLILVLAANTAYADFPRLASLLARDDYAPHQLAFRGERLAFSNGILLLGGQSALLIVLFAGSTGALLPLYAVSVFTAFTCSQAGMVQHWRRERGPRWRLKAAINGVGAVVTGFVTLLAASTNFMNPELPIVPGLPIGWGSWLVLVIVPLFIALCRKIKAHYEEAARATRLPPTPPPERPLRNAVVVPIARLNRPAVEALRYAKALSDNVTAVHVVDEAERAEDIQTAWARWGAGVPLTVIESPYRSLTRPLLQYLAQLRKVERVDYVTVVLPEYVPDSWWEHLLHGQSAQVLKLALLFTPGFVVTSVPCHEWRSSDQSAAAEPTGPRSSALRP
ncbi:MAG TPA: APC family permease [Chloroflexota bacterium]|nr:APC family permease [Chloroflexota bacterium]